MVADAPLFGLPKHGLDLQLTLYLCRSRAGANDLARDLVMQIGRAGPNACHFHDHLPLKVAGGGAFHPELLAASLRVYLGLHFALDFSRRCARAAELVGHLLP